MNDKIIWKNNTIEFKDINCINKDNEFNVERITFKKVKSIEDICINVNNINSIEFLDDSTEYIGREVFKNYNIEKLIFAKGNSNLSIMHEAFKKNIIKELKISRNKIDIKKDAFKYNKIEELYLHANESLNLHENAFQNNKLKKLFLYSDIIYFEENCIENEVNKRLESFYLYINKIKNYRIDCSKIRDMFNKMNPKKLYLPEKLFNEYYDYLFRELYRSIDIKFINEQVIKNLINI